MVLAGARAWLGAPAPIALQRQRPLSDDALMVVARGLKQDGGIDEPEAGLLL
jgi:hypothetical protein